MEQIYLDNNATTRIDPVVVEAMHACYGRRLANPASQHRSGQQARCIVETARDRIGEILGCRISSIYADRIIFTSGGTESNNLALLGMAGQPPARVLVSCIEHPSVMGPAQRLANLGYDVQQIPVHSSGVVDLAALERLLMNDTQLVSVMMANNETGVIQPIQEIVNLCRDRNVLMHTDAVQAVGKIPVEFAGLNVDALSVSAHKLHGPLGIGALIVRHGASIEPLLFGGFQQSGIRPGTEPAALCLGFQTALERWETEAAERYATVSRLRNQLESGLVSAGIGAVVNCTDAKRLPHTSCISFPGLDRQALFLALDLAGVACSTGSACASGSSEPSPVLLAMGLPKRIVDSALRFSLAVDTTATEIERAVGRISKLIHDLRQSKSP